MRMTPHQVQRYLHPAPAVRALELLELATVTMLPYLPAQGRRDQLATWTNRADPSAQDTGGRKRVRAEHLDLFLRNLPGFRHGV